VDRLADISRILGEHGLVFTVARRSAEPTVDLAALAATAPCSKRAREHILEKNAAQETWTTAQRGRCL
jgi:hypothetical protein